MYPGRRRGDKGEGGVEWDVSSFQTNERLGTSFLIVMLRLLFNVHRFAPAGHVGASSFMPLSSLKSVDPRHLELSQIDRTAEVDCFVHNK
jgi:hypothetical protein